MQNSKSSQLKSTNSNRIIDQRSNGDGKLHGESDQLLGNNKEYKQQASNGTIDKSSEQSENCGDESDGNLPDESDRQLGNSEEYKQQDSNGTAVKSSEQSENCGDESGGNLLDESDRQLGNSEEYKQQDSNGIAVKSSEQSDILVMKAVATCLMKKIDS